MSETNETDETSEASLTGSLILADPSLRDPNFLRTVLLLTEHSHVDGALGFVLNRPLGKRLGDILSAGESAGLGDIPVYLGGPVSTEQLTLACLHWHPETDRLAWETHLSMDEARNRDTEGFQVRAFIGYAGWSGGQLESELVQRAWITRRPDERVLQQSALESLWRELLKSMGPWYRLVAGTPEDPSLN